MTSALCGNRGSCPERGRPTEPQKILPRKLTIGESVSVWILDYPKSVIFVSVVTDRGAKRVEFTRGARIDSLGSAPESWGEG